MLNLKAYVRCFPALFHLRSGRTAAGRPLDVVELRLEVHDGNGQSMTSNAYGSLGLAPAATFALRPRPWSVTPRNVFRSPLMGLDVNREGTVMFAGGVETARGARGGRVQGTREQDRPRHLPRGTTAVEVLEEKTVHPQA